MNRDIQFTVVNYRNSIYQGMFNTKQQTRHGYGLIYILSEHTLIGSHWLNDKACGPTFVYKSSGDYMYGYWKDNCPDGFNLIKMKDMLIMGFYQKGVVTGNMLIIYQKYNFALIIQPIKSGHAPQFDVLAKGEIYSDEDFHKFINQSKWQYFEENWKTMIKFLSTNFYCEAINTPKLKLRLVNQIYYRFGFDDGIAVVFDNQYSLISMGVHKKSKLKQIGIRRTQQNFIQLGNFSSSQKVKAYNLNKLPNDHKIQPLIIQQLLKGPNFVNQYHKNPVSSLFQYYHQLSQCKIFKGLLSGMITNRKIDNSYQSQSLFGTNKSNHEFNKLLISESKARFGSIRYQSKKSNHSQHVNNHINTVNVVSDQYGDEKITKNNQQQQKRNLQILKKQIMSQISKKQKIKDNYLNDILLQNNQRKYIIHKMPVNIASNDKPNTKNDNNKPNAIIQYEQYQEQKRKPEHKSKKSLPKHRSPIFTPEKSNKIYANDSDVSRSPSPYVDRTASPFRQKMRKKIFKQQQKKKTYAYQPISGNKSYDVKIPTSDLNKTKKFQSPYNNLELSHSKGESKYHESVFPVSIQASKNNKYLYQKQQQAVDHRHSSKSNFANNHNNKQQQQIYRSASKQKQKTKRVQFVGISPDQLQNQGVIRQKYGLNSKQNQTTRKNAVYLANENRKSHVDGVPGDYDRRYSRSKPQSYLGQYRQQNSAYSPAKDVKHIKQTSADDYQSRNKYNKAIQAYNNNSKIQKIAHKTNNSPYSRKKQPAISQISPRHKKHQFYFN